MSNIQFQNINFRYGDEAILQHFSLEISRGSRIAIQGESGTGKTTLLRLLLGFEQPDAGIIYFEQTPVSTDNYSSIRQSAAWLPQEMNIGDGSVEEVLQRPFEFTHNKNMMPDANTINDILIKLGLSADTLEKPFRDLSTGQRQRVGIALCHLLDRPLLLLDEPTSALDEASKQKAVDLLFADSNRTIISTTHDPFWLERCDRVIKLN